MTGPEGADLHWERWERLFQLRVSQQQREKVRTYLGLLLKWKGAINLTARNSVDEFLQLDFFESFWVAQRWLKDPVRLFDIGSGAGFPGLALKLQQPKLHLSLVEASHKRCVFLKQVARALQLDAEVHRVRAEEFRNWRQGVASMRALRPSRQLLELLHQHRIGLIYLHGERLPGALGAVRADEVALVPGSKQRFASFFNWRSLGPQ